MGILLHARCEAMTRRPPLRHFRAGICATYNLTRGSSARNAARGTAEWTLAVDARPFLSTAVVLASQKYRSTRLFFTSVYVLKRRLPFPSLPLRRLLLLLSSAAVEPSFAWQVFRHGRLILSIPNPVGNLRRGHRSDTATLLSAHV